MKKSSFFIVAVLMFCALSSTAMAVVDDHGNSISTATLINANSSTAGLIGAAGDNDYFKIILTSSGTLTVNTTGSTDTFGYLLDSNNTTLISNDDTNFSNRNFRIVRALSAGTYYIRMRHFSSNQVGRYVLVSSFVSSDDHGGSISTATTIAANSSTAGLIGAAGDNDYFKIILTSSGTLTVNTTGSTDTYGYLVDSNNTTLISNDDASFSNHNFRIVRTLNAGTYYVRVRHYNASRTGAYSFISSFSAVVSSGNNSVADDHGNTNLTATTINANSNTIGVIEMAGDNDYFKVVLASAGTLTVKTTGSTDTYGDLLDVNNRRLRFSDDAAFNDRNFLITQPLSAGIYYIRVRHFNTRGTGSYSLVSSFSAANVTVSNQGNSAATAIVINANSSIAGSIGSAGENDYFKIVLANAGTLTVNTTGSTDTYGYLLDNNSNVLNNPGANEDAGVNRNFQISRSLSAGTYYIRVRHYNSSRTGNYTLVSTFSTGAASIQVTSPNGGENIARGGTYVIRWSAANFSGNVDIQLYKNSLSFGSVQIVQNAPNSGSYTWTLPANGLIGNDFRIRISSHNNWGSIFDFSDVNFTIGRGGRAADDHGDSTTAATAINANSSTAGSIGSAGDNDYFKIVLANAGRLSVNTTGSSDTVGNLLDSNNNIINNQANDDDAGAGSNFRITESLSAGTYYVRVRHYNSQRTGSYTLQSAFVSSSATRVNDDHGDSPASATLVNLNATYPAAIESRGDIDYFKIVLTSSGRLLVKSTGNYDMYGYLFDSNNNVLGVDDDSGTGNNFQITKSLNAGTYYVRANHYSRDHTAAYHLVIAFDGSTTALPGDDHGNSTASATAINPSSSSAGNIETGGDVDYFKIILPSAGTLTLKSTGTTDTFGRLLDSNGNQISANDDGTDTNFLISQALGAGTYYLKLRHYDEVRGTGGYILVSAFSSGASLSRNVSTGARQNVLLLLHGMNSSTATWNDFLLSIRSTKNIQICPEIYNGVIIGGASTTVTKCYRVKFGAHDGNRRTGLEGRFYRDASHSTEQPTGDFSTFSDLATEVDDAIAAIRANHVNANIVLIGHSRGGIAARKFLQTPVSSPKKASVSGLLTIGTPHKGSPLGRVYNYLAVHTRPPSGSATSDSTADWQVVDFLNGQKYCAAVDVRNPSGYLPVGDQLDLRKPTIHDLSDNSGGIALLNYNVSNLPASLIYGQIIFDGKKLGNLDNYYSVFNLGFWTLSNSCDQVSTTLKDAIVGPLRLSAYHGDGIVPLNFQKYNDIDGFHGRMAYARAYTGYVHIKELTNVVAIRTALSNMFSWW